MKIAMLGHKRIPSREGGVEIVVSELGTRMVQRGHSVTVYNRGGHHVSGSEYDRKRIKSYNGIKIKRALTVDSKGLAAVTSSIFGAIACAFGKYDVVHFHAEGPSILCGFTKRFGKRIIVTIHGLDHKRAKWGRFASWYIMRGEKAAVKHADEIIVLSEGVRDYFKEVYGRETVYIPNGVNKANPVEAKLIEEKWGLKKDSYILFLGRLVPEKGIHYLIEAYKKQNTDKKLVIAGGSSDTTEYTELLRLNESEDIIFTDFVQGRELEELYSNAYIYCLPSDLEGMPLSLLEAMSYGNACLVSDIEECAKVVSDKGVIFEKGNVDDLAEKLRLLLDDEEKVRGLKNQAAEYITKRFDWEEVVNKTLGLYNS